MRPIYFSYQLGSWPLFKGHPQYSAFPILSPGMFPLLFCFALLFASALSVSKPDDPTYVGAVVEYAREWNFNLTAEENVMKNVHNYINFINQAHDKNVDIIVFPEVGLLAANQLFIPVPDPKDNVIPRLDSKQHEVLRKLSEAAYNNTMYVIVNLHELFESDGKVLRYNTNVGFDRSGAIIARYRKYNLYGESYLNRTDEPEYSYFKTDFGVTFGLFTCFDVLFAQPSLHLITNYGVTDIAFPSAWFSQMPFLNAIQEQNGWAYGTGVNLLAAGLNNPSIGHTGSGIYTGQDGPDTSFILYEITKSSLIVKEIKKKKENLMNPEEKFGLHDNSIEEEIVPAQVELPKESKLHLLVEDLKIYQTELLAPPYDSEIKVEKNNGEIKKYYSIHKRICQKSFCCDYHVEVNLVFGPKGAGTISNKIKGDDYHYFRYRFAVLDGVRSFGGQATGGLQVCGIIPCLDDSLSSCGRRADSRTVRLAGIPEEDLELRDTTFTAVRINGTFVSNDSFLTPNVLLTSDQVGGPDVVFGKIPRKDQMEFAKSKVDGGLEGRLTLTDGGRGLEVVSAGLLCRVFSRDGSHVSQSMSNNNTASYMIALALITAVFVGWPYMIPGRQS